MARRRVPKDIPREAVEVPLGEGGHGFDYRLGERLVARVYYHPTGAIDWETHYDEVGRLHGVERQQHESGRRRYRARWVHGRQHGLQQQWDEAGELLGETRFVDGTGVDLWFACGGLAEQREYVGGKRHGVERWWSGPREVWRECRWRAGREHGIEREWNDHGRLRRGFPRYWVDGERVTRRRYARARASDPTLPAIDPRDDRPRRTPPAVRAVRRG